MGPEGLGPEFAPKSCDDFPDLGKCKNGDDDSDDPKVGLLFPSPAFDCALGAVPTGASTGTVTWENVRRQDSHIHATVQLTGVTQGSYDIFGNQDTVCPGLIDFDLRPLHATQVIVDAFGNGNARIGLTFGAENAQGDPLDPAGHEQGAHQLWLTVTGGGGIFRSSAVEVVLKKHKGH